MLEIEKPRIEVEEYIKDEFYGKFVIEPLKRGYGTTLGNSLRRVLLSSLPGAAVTSISIEGVQHEFTSIDGVVEDVTQIILNLKPYINDFHFSFVNNGEYFFINDKKIVYWFIT